MHIFHTSPKKNSALALLGGLGVGALLMYVLDPQRGAQRRALARDKATRLGHRAGEALAARSRDLRNRTRGVAAKTRSLVHKEEDVPNEVLAERVRSRIGRVVGHPGSIEVAASNGIVTLSGPVLEEEVDELLAAVRETPGVEEVEDRLEVHEEPDDVPGLQGDRRPERETF
ncbi:MAG: BON domain-containing protein [Thermoanaerobaculia bacterium]